MEKLDIKEITHQTDCGEYVSQEPIVDKINEIVDYINQHEKEHKACQISLCAECGKKHDIITCPCPCHDVEEVPVEEVAEEIRGKTWDLPDCLYLRIGGILKNYQIFRRSDGRD